MVNAKNAWTKNNVYGHDEDATFLRQRIISVFGLPIEHQSIGYTLPDVMHVNIKPSQKNDRWHTYFPMVMETQMHICCPVCLEATSVDAEQLWDTDSDEHLFQRKYYEHCKTHNRLGSCLHSITHHLPPCTWLRNRYFYNQNTKPLHNIRVCVVLRLQGCCETCLR